VIGKLPLFNNITAYPKSRYTNYMLYIFYGTNTIVSSNKARVLINSLRTKKTDASFLEIDANNWSSAIVEEQAGGQGLFSSKSIVLLNRVTENAEAKESLSDFLEIMKKSQNIFIILEGKILVDLKRAFEKHAEKIVVSDITESAPKKEFNIFALGDAVSARNYFKAWLIYRQAIESGTAPEGIVGTLFWKIKTMIVSLGASKSSGNYSKDELFSLMERLIVLYHDGHRGMCDMELAIERLLLTC